MFILSPTPVPIFRILVGGTPQALDLGLRSLRLGNAFILILVLELDLRQLSLLGSLSHDLEYPLRVLLPL